MLQKEAIKLTLKVHMLCILMAETCGGCSYWQAHTRVLFIFFPFPAISSDQ